MDWDIIGATGEWAGAIAVVITLFYLARQLKDDTAVARGSARQALSQMNVDAWSVSIDAGVLSRAQAKLSAGEALDLEERQNYDRWIVMRMRFIENAFYQHRAGLLDGEEWDGYRRLSSYLVGPSSPAHAYWKIASNGFSQPFVDEVDRVVSENPNAAMS